MNKLVKASELVNLAIEDREAFLSRKFTGKYNSNVSTNPADARWHTHQDSIAIDKLMKIVTARSSQETFARFARWSASDKTAF